LSFLGEIKRRHVFQVAIAYVVVAWVILQVVDVVKEPLNLPNGFDTAVIVLVAIGLPLALVLAWAFDLTSIGVVRTPPAAAASATAPAPTPAAPSPASTPAPSAAPARPKRLRNSVAVLPLDNLSPNPDDAYFAAGIHEEILNQLAKIRDLSVIARTSVKKYQDTDKSIAEIGMELGVRTVMEGSVRYAGERVRVTAQLIDAATEDHLWSEVYERDLADVFAIQADVATKIAAALKAELSLAERLSVERLPTDSTEAYGLYLRAMAILQEHGHPVGALKGPSDAIQSYLDRAIELDPKFALAYVARASLNASRLNQDPGIYAESATRRVELESLALQDVEKALALDPGIGAAHGILARIHQFNWRGAEARAAYLRALELSPSSIEVLIDFAVFCAITGRLDEAREHANRAIELDPSSPQVHDWLAYILFFRGELQGALEAARRAVSLMPTYVMGHAIIGVVEALLGNREESLRETRLAERLMRDFINPALVGQLAANYHRAGDQEGVERIHRRIQEMADRGHVPHVTWIWVYLSLGDDERALEHLKAAGDDPESYVGHFGIMMVKFNLQRFATLEEPRFREARERLPFKD
jgi:adenylate cyclase